MRDPATAPPRPDLGWLRHRGGRARVDYVHHRPAQDVEPRAAAPVLDLAPTQAPPAPPAPTLDLAPSAAAPVAEVALPLDLPAPAAGATFRRRTPERLPYPRVQPGATVVLSRRHPTVTLTRVQSGIGQLAVALLPGPAAGDLAVGVVCQTDDGAMQVVQRAGDVLAATTPGSPLPLVRLVRDEGRDVVLVDLRSVRRLRRALFYGFSPSVSVLTWDALLRVGLHDGSRLEVPVDLPPLRGTVALLTLYVVDGEIVVRAEREPFAGPPETAALAYGYTHGWLDGRLPAP